MLEILLLFCLSPASSLRGPPRAERREVQQVVKEGQTARLRCPITGSPAPLVTWSHRGEGIGWSWTRYRQNRRNLKIKKAVKQDTGPYVCKGTNGFGNAEVQINLIVIDPKDFPGIEDKDLPSLAPPVLTSETQAQEEVLIVNTGDTFKLSCSARGFPAPLYSWYKDGEVRRGSGSDLVVSKAHQGHAGLWACRAQNMVGNVGRTFRVKVRLEAGQDEEKKDEVIVEEGDKAVLQCRVSGPKIPKVRWLRRLGEQPMSDEEQVIAVGRERYQLLDSGLATHRLRPNLWHSTLTIEQADFSHAGPYICFVDGRAGFHFSSTRLRVEPKHRQLVDIDMVEQGVPVVGLTLTLVLIIALLLTAAIFCLVHKRPKTPASICEEGEQQFEQRLSSSKRKIEGECRLEKLLEIPASQLQINVSREEEGEEGEVEEESLAYYSHQYSPKKSHEKFNRSFHSYS